tara:strand:+ start:84 stop:296 length:213 start_codon:yes stop_codon:yes gene_type:complete
MKAYDLVRVWDAKVGDLVQADSFLENIGGKTGVITFLQDENEYCRSARVLFDTGVVFMRLDNVRCVSESR